MTGRLEAQSSVSKGFVAALIIFVLIMVACVGYLKPELTRYRQMTAAARDTAVSLHVQMKDISAREARDVVERRKFEELEKVGFLGQQNRLQAARLLEKLRIQYRVSGLEYQIEPVQTLSVLRQPENSGVMMSVSKISLSMRGFLDGDLRDFAMAVKRSFPGHITLTAMEMTKLTQLDNELLVKISRGGGTELVGGTVEMQWQVARPAKDDAGL